jgi:hypothetical protein
MMNEIEGNKSRYDKFFETGILEGAQGELKPDPSEAPPIDVSLNLPQQGGRLGVSNEATTPNSPTIPLPNVTPSNLPVTGRSTTEQALALDTIRPFS